MKYTLLILALFFTHSAVQAIQPTASIQQEQAVDRDSLVSEVMTKSDQDKMTPDEILRDMIRGNERYVNNALTHWDVKSQTEATSTGQYPKAVILSCIDSRVPVEMVFDQGIGDVFVARVAGNIEDKDLLGSMEYGLGVAGSKVLMILGHQSCGAVKSAIDKVDVGSTNVDHLLEQIEPAISDTEGARDSGDPHYVSKVVKTNVRQTMDDIRDRSEIIRSLEKEGKIKIVGAYYSLTDGRVTIID